MALRGFVPAELCESLLHCKYMDSRNRPVRVIRQCETDKPKLLRVPCKHKLRDGFCACCEYQEGVARKDTSSCMILDLYAASIQ
jgi:hypothetical protein